MLLSTLFPNTLNLFVPRCEKPSFTPKQNSRQNYRFVYLKKIGMWQNIHIMEIEAFILLYFIF
jgi:hypothetical protein